MTEENKISVIMPVKDTAKYLRTCLDSIIDQTYTNWELLAVDDRSSDSSLSILKEYAQKDDRISAISNPEPSLLNALRLGYSHSSGALIHRMDSDDYMPHEKLRRMIEKSKKGVLVTGATEYFSDEAPIGDGFRRYDKWLMEIAEVQSYREEMYKECVIPSNCWLIHREDFDRVKGFELDTFPEDYDLCFRFLDAGLNIVGIPEVLHNWRDRSDRISRNWDAYKDNRFFNLKIVYFYRISRDSKRPLVLWGAGKNGKDLAKLILLNENNFHWICDNAKKIGKDIYDIRMHHFDHLLKLDNPQLIIAVASPDGQIEIQQILDKLNLKKGVDYWFFA
ncbi:MAG: glycosyltransferase [Flavobacteriales bacterium]